MTAYSRSNPSPTYRELEAVYGTMHSDGVPQENLASTGVFDGRSLINHVDDVRDLCRATRSKSILDYGSGKAKHYKAETLSLSGNREIPGLKTYWGVDEVTCYDPGVEAFSNLPEGMFDGVISTDVLEHIPEDDIDWVLAELFGYGRKFVYANIAGYPAAKKLPNGWNAHITVKEPEWWKERIAKAAANWSGEKYMFSYETKPRGWLRKVREIAGVAPYPKYTIAKR